MENLERPLQSNNFHKQYPLSDWNRRKDITATHVQWAKCGWVLEVAKIEPDYKRTGCDPPSRFVRQSRTQFGLDIAEIAKLGTVCWQFTTCVIRQHDKYLGHILDCCWASQLCQEIYQPFAWCRQDHVIFTRLGLIKKPLRALFSFGASVVLLQQTFLWGHQNTFIIVFLWRYTWMLSEKLNQQS